MAVDGEPFYIRVAEKLMGLNGNDNLGFVVGAAKGKTDDELARIRKIAPDIPILLALHQERERNSQQFFRHNADKFKAQQDLIASYEQYADTVAQVLAEAPLQQRRLALEVGPGDGAFLAELSPAFERVVALDNSAEMLERAQQLARDRGLQNIDFLLGDTSHADLAGMRADCIVVNMVLHGMAGASHFVTSQ